MKNDQSSYFIALVPQGEVSKKAIILKRYFAMHYSSKSALRSPPHITLHMPFRLRDQKEEAVKNDLEKLSQTIPSFVVEIRGFGCFEPRVIFLNIQSSPLLTSAFEGVQTLAKSRWKIFNSTHKSGPFIPHMTVAFRDLKKNQFHQAWNRLKEVECNTSFICNHITLLKHDSKRWQVIFNAPLGGQSSKS